MPDINITNHVHAVKSWSMLSLAQSWPMQTNAIYCIPFNTVFERKKKQIMWTQKLEFIDDVTKNMKNSVQTDVKFTFDKVSQSQTKLLWDTG